MDDSKAVLTGLGMVIGGIIGLAVVIASCERASVAIDAAAPVVESCIKHPATRTPFTRGTSQ